MALRLMDRRISESVLLPRFHVEEQLVDIQAASKEASMWMERAAKLLDSGHVDAVPTAMGHADTLVRLIDHTAYELAGDIRACPNGLNGPNGHAA